MAETTTQDGTTINYSMSGAGDGPTVMLSHLVDPDRFAARLEAFWA